MSAVDHATSVSPHVESFAPQSAPDDDCTSHYPQPTDGAEPYKYVRQEHVDELIDDIAPLSKGSACWVMLSKGKGASPQLFKPARVAELQPNSDRITVQYPKGSTYKVRRTNLMPTLEHAKNLVLVASETTDYRRLATVHTTTQDHFVEIGCDFGILVDSVVAKSSLGIDKSKESIDIARQRYPTQEFILGDVFEDGLKELPPRKAEGGSLVVAIDINGNRDLPAVLKCIQLVMAWSPRLIIAKSRALHAKMVEEQK